MDKSQFRLMLTDRGFKLQRLGKTQWHDVPVVDRDGKPIRTEDGAVGTEIVTHMDRNTDAQAAVIELLKGYVQELKDARAANDPAAMDAVIERIDANTAKAAAAVVAGTPAAPSQS